MDVKPQSRTKVCAETRPQPNFAAAARSAGHGIPPISIALGASYFQRLLVRDPGMQVKG